MKEDFKKYYQAELAKYQEEVKVDADDEEADHEEVKNEDDKGERFKNILEGNEELNDENVNEMMKEWVQSGADME